MTRALKVFVHVLKKDGSAVWFGPGDQPPKWAASQITNPKAWDGDAPARSVAPTPPVVPVTPVEPVVPVVPDPIVPDPVVPVVPEPVVPAGNATREEWAAYADALGVAYEPEAKREAIKEAVEQATAEKAAAEPSA